MRKFWNLFGFVAAVATILLGVAAVKVAVISQRMSNEIEGAAAQATPVSPVPTLAPTPTPWGAQYFTRPTSTPLPVDPMTKPGGKIPIFVLGVCFFCLAPIWALVFGVKKLEAFLRSRRPKPSDDPIQGDTGSDDSSGGNWEAPGG